MKPLFLLFFAGKSLKKEEAGGNRDARVCDIKGGPTVMDNGDGDINKIDNITSGKILPKREVFCMGEEKSLEESIGKVSQNPCDEEHAAEAERGGRKNASFKKNNENNQGNNRNGEKDIS